MPSKIQRWIEFLLLFVGVPIAMLVWFGHYSLFGLVWILAGIAGVLLAMTPGFRFAQLFKGPVLSEWRFLLLFSIATTIVCVGLSLWLLPEYFLHFPKHRQGIWLMILLLYPFISAWPQELLYRSLFFERYGSLFGSGVIVPILINGILFGFGHLFYREPVTITLCTIGGIVMAWAYLKHRSLALAWAVHAIAGNLVFTIGLGRFFYQGAIGQ